MRKRILMIGWDGATWDYIDQFLQQGKLPNLANLIQSGVRAELRSTTPSWTSIAWPSLITGLWPGKTHVYDGLVRQPERYEAVPTNLMSFDGIRLWNWFNRFGKSAGIVNVPMTYPSAPLDGYIVPGFDSPAKASNATFPEDLVTKWRSKGIAYEISRKQVELLKETNIDRFTSMCKEIALDQGDIIAKLWLEEPVDLLFTVFMSTDAINHRTWDMQRIASVYQAADRALGTILEVAYDAQLICLVSDHGSAPAHSYVSLYKLLSEHRWLHFRPEIASQFWRRMPGIAGIWASKLWESLPEIIRNILSRPWLRLVPQLACSFDNIDWKRTSVYPLTPIGPLYVNREGREPDGIVKDTQLEAVRDEVIRTLQEVRAPKTNKPLFSAVRRGQDGFPGCALDDATCPDLLFELSDHHYHMITGYPTDPLIRLIPQTNEYGTHTPEGIFLLSGAGVKTDITLPPVQRQLELPIDDN